MEKPVWTGTGEGLGVAEGQDEEPLLSQPLTGGELLRKPSQLAWREPE